MDKILKSKWFAWTGMIACIAWLVGAVINGANKPMYTYLPIFFVFMSAFCNLASVYLANISLVASKKLDKIDLIFGILFFLSIIIIFFVM